MSYMANITVNHNHFKKALIVNLYLTHHTQNPDI